MNAINVMGIDLTASEWKPTACAVLDSDGALAWLSKNTSDLSIIELAERYSPAVVAIDSPLGLPKGMRSLDDNHDCESAREFKGRKCERDIRERLGVSIFLTTKKSIIRDMIPRAIRLAEMMRCRGMEVIEVYPYASKRVLFGDGLPKNKKSAAARRYVVGKLKPLVSGLESAPGNLDDDLIDAIIAAYTARLYIQGDCDHFGISEEGLIYTPKSRNVR